MQPILTQNFSFKLSKYQVIPLAAILTILTIMLFFKFSPALNTRATTWESALNNTPAALFKKVLSVDMAPEIDQKLVKVMQIPSQGAGKLYLFDYHSPKLCGAKGCLYSMYTESGELVLQVIANPNLPPLTNLIQVSDTVNQKFPCMVVTQSANKEDMVTNNLYCYEGHKYARFNESLTAVTSEVKGIKK
ncbi:hypothetical protein DSM106972_067400 [Dulcicalothrix desertica PCC 7102]|uniref:Uncharacterized protein n=1 Tax=Dulcicalothrix desertica PCC 7102 TaxID=232991 RepID=A0A433V698_9CYAN|nr:histidine kinase [Dulcicalothrix desertica]RUT01643.1 hypothetical protein DSM106972_067400 [Dulcicalothrix desertica PCC 7102]TWH43839.1 hypothetical protein CAL7102_07583 [Dulcicalothrix desertica PCC 7102]